MSFIKALIIALLVTFLATYFLGISMLGLIDGYAGEPMSWLESVKAINVSAIAALAIIFLASFVVLMLFGTVILVVSVIFFAIALSVLGVFWPIIAAIVLYYVCRDKKDADYYCG